MLTTADKKRFKKGQLKISDKQLVYQALYQKEPERYVNDQPIEFFEVINELFKAKSHMKLKTEAYLHKCYNVPKTTSRDKFRDIFDDFSTKLEKAMWEHEETRMQQYGIDSDKNQIGNEHIAEQEMEKELDFYKRQNADMKDCLWSMVENSKDSLRLQQDGLAKIFQ